MRLSKRVCVEARSLEDAERIVEEISPMYEEELLDEPYDAYHDDFEIEIFETPEEE